MHPICRRLRWQRIYWDENERVKTMREKFEDFYRVLAPRLTGYFVSNGTTYETACEIVQESFLKLWKIRDTLDDDMERVSGLLWTIARNVRTDRFRRENRITYDSEAGVDVADTSASPSDSGDIAYLRQRITAALATLPPLLRDAYTLFHVAELPIREIARQTNVSETLVKVRIFRAKEKLQVALKDLKTWR